MSTGKTYSTKYLLDSNNNRGSEGQILSTTSTGIDWVDANTVPGTGLWVTSGNNIYNSNSGNVGIGTTSPQDLLEVRAANGVTGVIRVQGGKNTVTSIGEVNSRLDFGSNDGSVASPFVGGRIASVTELANGARTGLAFSTYLQSRPGDDLMEFVRITSEGNVGIGTTSPAAKLHVDGNQYIDGDLDIKSPGVGNSITVLQSTSGNAVVNIGESAVGHGFLSLYEVGVGDVIKFDANANSFINRGNVGIGTTSPGAKLQVYSTATRDISIFGHGTQAQNNWQAQHAFFISAGQGVMISKANASNNTNRLHLFYSTSNGDAQYMLHDTNSNDKVKLNTNGDSHFNGGNVGIGTTSPSTKLEVTGHVTINSPAGASQTSYGLRLRKTNSSSAVQAGGEILASVYPPNTNAANLIFKTANASANLTQRMVIDGIGNVGIGTTSPSA